jgi:hypothetical protein
MPTGATSPPKLPIDKNLLVRRRLRSQGGQDRLVLKMTQFCFAQSPRLPCCSSIEQCLRPQQAADLVRPQ